MPNILMKTHRILIQLKIINQIMQKSLPKIFIKNKSNHLLLPINIEMYLIWNKILKIKKMIINFLKIIQISTASFKKDQLQEQKKILNNY